MAAVTSPRAQNIPDDPDRLRLDGWDYITTVPAFGDSAYQCVSPTLCDSTAEAGICWSTFLVRAMTSDPFTSYDSAPAEGYSIDNLAPGAPRHLRFESPSILAWDDATEPDFEHYSIYGSQEETFDREDAQLIAHTITPSVDVAGHWYSFYHVTVSDVAGNQGDAATEPADPAAIENGAGGLPAHLTIDPIRPNPSAGSMRLSFALPNSATVRLNLIDASGRVVARSESGPLSAGRHELNWIPLSPRGDPISSGAYFCRIAAGGETRTEKVFITR
jgi:hypothetical protein